MKNFLVLTALALTVSLSGCVTSRGLVSLNAPQTTTQTSNLKKTAYIQIVEDERQFENKPRTPNIPSLKGGLAKATADDKAKAIARKRNGYGRALGDILLREGTVTSTVQSRVENALNQAGYKVVTSNTQVPADLVISVHVDKFWSWVNIGAWVVTINTEIKTDIDLKDSPQKITTETKISTPVAVASGSTWIKNNNIALDDYENKLITQLKQIN